MSLPINLPLPQMQTKWKSEIDPFLANPANQSILLKSVNLVSGVNVINHLLGRQMQGWMLTDIQGGWATVYRSGPMNNLTLTLTASAPVTVNIEVF